MTIFNKILSSKLTSGKSEESAGNTKYKLLGEMPKITRMMDYTFKLRGTAAWLLIKDKDEYLEKMKKLGYDGVFDAEIDTFWSELADNKDYQTIKNFVLQSECLTLLSKIILDPKLEVFMMECGSTLMRYLYYIDIRNLKPTNPDPSINQIILDGKYYNVAEEDWDSYQACHLKEANGFLVSIAGETDNLDGKIRQLVKNHNPDKCDTRDEIKKSHKLLNLKEFFTELFKDEDLPSFLKSHFNRIFSITKNYEKEFGLTNLGIQTGEIICQYICYKHGELHEVMKTISQMVNKIPVQYTEEKKRSIMDVIKRIMGNPEIKTETQSIIMSYVRDHLCKNYKEANGYFQELYDFMDNHLKNNKYDSDATKQMLLKIGVYLLELCIDVKIFEKLTAQKETVQQIYLRPTRSIYIEHKFRTKVITPFFTEGQIHETLYNFRNKKISDEKKHIQKKRFEFTNKIEDDEKALPLYYIMPFFDRECRIDENIYYNILMANSTEKIHNSRRMTLSINPNSYLGTKPALYTKYSIDYDYLSWFLNMLLDSSHISTSDSDELSKLSEFLLTLFDIDLNKLFEFAERDEQYRGVVQVVQFYVTSWDRNWTALEMKNQYDKLYGKETGFENRKIMHKILDKLIQRKYFFVELIKECILCCPYKFVIFTDFLDPRGRSYINTPFLNMNSNPVGKALIRLYNSCDNNHPTLEELNTIKECLTDTETRNKMEDLIFKTPNDDDLDKARKEATYNYIASFFKGAVTPAEIEGLVATITNAQNRSYDRKTDFIFLSTILKGLKKRKTLFIVHSLIYFEHRRNVFPRNYMSNHVDKDATSSGLQMMSIFFRSLSLAQISNLSGKSNYGIYQMATDYCRNMYLLCEEVCLMVLKCVNLDFKAFGEIDSGPRSYKAKDFEGISTNFVECFRIWVNLDFTNTSYTVDLLEFLSKNLPGPMQECSIKINKLSKMLMNAPLTDLYKNLVKLEAFESRKDNLNALLMLRGVVRLCYIAREMYHIDAHNDSSLLRTRNLFKDLIMTTVYMSTAYGRKQAFRDIYEETATVPIPVKRGQEARFAELIRFFDHCGCEYLATVPDVAWIRKYVDDLVKVAKDKNVTDVTLTTQHVTVTLTPPITVQFQVSTATVNKKRGPQLMVTQNKRGPDGQIILNYKKLRSMLMANVAHAIDANIMLNCISLVSSINETLRRKSNKKNIPFQLVLKINHDCFII